MRRSLYESFNDCEGLKQLNPSVRQAFIYVVITLRSELQKIKIALLALTANVTGEQGVGAFIGLELQAKAREQSAASASPETIVL